MKKLFSILLVLSLNFSLAWAQGTTSGTVLGTVQDSYRCCAAGSRSDGHTCRHRDSQNRHKQ